MRSSLMTDDRTTSCSRQHEEGSLKHETFINPPKVLALAGMTVPGLSLCALQKVIRGSPRYHRFPSSWTGVKLQAGYSQHVVEHAI